jgi:hypothetical protein
MTAGAGVAGAGTGPPATVVATAAASTGSGAAAVVVSMPGMASTIVPDVISGAAAAVVATPGAVTGAMVGSPAATGLADWPADSAASVGSAGRLADAITAVSARMPDAVSPLTAMRAPAATCARRLEPGFVAPERSPLVRRVGAGCAFCCAGCWPIDVGCIITTIGGAGGVVGAAHVSAGSTAWRADDGSALAGDGIAV